MDELEELLKKYSDISISILENLDKDDFDTLNVLLTERQKLIDSINKMDYSTTKFKEVSDKLKLPEYEVKINLLTKEKRKNIRDELDKTYQIKNANSKYKKGFSVDSVFFNKKI